MSVTRAIRIILGMIREVNFTWSELNFFDDFDRFWVIAYIARKHTYAIHADASHPNEIALFFVTSIIAYMSII